MNRFIIIDGLPYLYADKKAFAVRWNDEGFTVGEEVKLTSSPGALYSDMEIKAKCEVLDSIGAAVKTEPAKSAGGKKRATSRR